MLDSLKQAGKDIPAGTLQGVRVRPNARRGKILLRRICMIRKQGIFSTTQQLE